jgi:hypothetical protein
MTSAGFSFIVFCSYDLLADSTRVRVVSVSTGKDVPLRDGSFLLRISIDEDASLVRCFIRHVASGREAYVQSGPNLRAFIKDCLLNYPGETNE